MNGWTGSALESNRRECMPCQAKDKTREVFCSALREPVLFFRPHFWVIKSLYTIQHTREFRTIYPSLWYIFEKLGMDRCRRPCTDCFHAVL